MSLFTFGPELGRKRNLIFFLLPLALLQFIRKIKQKQLRKYAYGDFTVRYRVMAEMINLFLGNNSSCLQEFSLFSPSAWGFLGKNKVCCHNDMVGS